MEKQKQTKNQRPQKWADVLPMLQQSVAGGPQQALCCGTGGTFCCHAVSAAEWLPLWQPQVCAFWPIWCALCRCSLTFSWSFGFVLPFVRGGNWDISKCLLGLFRWRGKSELVHQSLQILFFFFSLPPPQLSLQSQSFLCSVCRWDTDSDPRAASGKESVPQDGCELSQLVSAPLGKKKIINHWIRQLEFSRAAGFWGCEELQFTGGMSCNEATPCKVQAITAPMFREVAACARWSLHFICRVVCSGSVPPAS